MVVVNHLASGNSGLRQSQVAGLVRVAEEAASEFWLTGGLIRSVIEMLLD